MIIVAATLLFFGPNKIPEIARVLARAYRELTKWRSKVDDTISELRQEIDLNLDDTVGKLPDIRPAQFSLGQPHVSARADIEHSQPVVLPVPPEDDYLTSAVAVAVPAAEEPGFGLEDYLREGGG